MFRGAHNNEDNFKKKKMKLLTKDQQESYENAKICHIFKEKFENIVELEIIAFMQQNIEVVRITCVI